MSTSKKSFQCFHTLEKFHSSEIVLVRLLHYALPKPKNNCPFDIICTIIFDLFCFGVFTFANLKVRFRQILEILIVCCFMYFISDSSVKQVQQK